MKSRNRIRAAPAARLTTVKGATGTIRTAITASRPCLPEAPADRGEARAGQALHQVAGQDASQPEAGCRTEQRARPRIQQRGDRPEHQPGRQDQQRDRERDERREQISAEDQQRRKRGVREDLEVGRPMTQRRAARAGESSARRRQGRQRPAEQRPPLASRRAATGRLRRGTNCSGEPVRIDRAFRVDDRRVEDEGVFLRGCIRIERRQRSGVAAQRLDRADERAVLRERARDLLGRHVQVLGQQAVAQQRNGTLDARLAGLEGEVAFGVVAQRAVVQIGRPDFREAIVHDHELAVQVDALLAQTGVIGVVGPQASIPIGRAQCAQHAARAARPWCSPRASRRRAAATRARSRARRAPRAAAPARRRWPVR